MYGFIPAVAVEEVKVHDRPSNAFHPVSLADIVAGMVKHTHVQVAVQIDKLHNEKDGDVHMHVSEGEYGLVCEIIPEIPIDPPTVGSHVMIEGILRYDKQHDWSEIHPVIKIEPLSITVPTQ